MVVTDTAGAVVLMAEDAQPFLAAGLPNPYEALFAGTPSVLGARGHAVEPIAGGAPGLGVTAQDPDRSRR